MKTRKMIVPRYVIERHYPHPELYGESIVVLENGLTTDVYTDLDGTLFTETNQKELIDYLRFKTKIEERNEISKSEIKLSTITFEHQELLKTWFTISPLRRLDLMLDSNEIIRQYISHSKTKNSEVFMIEMNSVKVGIIGFSVIDSVSITHAEIYEHRHSSISDFQLVIQLIIEHLKKRFVLKKISFLVSEYDDLIIDALKQKQWIKSQKTPTLLPTSTGFIIEFEYEYKMT
jgi:hypothetical protein